MDREALVDPPETSPERAPEAPDQLRGAFIGREIFRAFSGLLERQERMLRKAPGPDLRRTVHIKRPFKTILNKGLQKYTKTVL